MLMHEKACVIPIFGVAPIGCGDLVLVLCYVVWFLVSFLAITLLRKRNVSLRSSLTLVTKALARQNTFCLIT